MLETYNLIKTSITTICTDELKRAKKVLSFDTDCRKLKIARNSKGCIFQVSESNSGGKWSRNQAKISIGIISDSLPLHAITKTLRRRLADIN